MKRAILFVSAMLVASVCLGQSYDRWGVQDLGPRHSWTRTFSDGTDTTVYGIEPFNVIGFGATPDDGNDDTEAIQAAIDSVESWGGGAIYIPSGTFKISTGLTIDTGGVHLWGGGATETVLGYSGSGGSNGDYIITVDGVSGVSIRDMTITNGPAEDIGTGGPGTGGCVLLDEADDVVIRDVLFDECGGIYGLRLFKAENVKVENCTFSNIAYNAMNVAAQCENVTVRYSIFREIVKSATAVPGVANRYFFATSGGGLYASDTTLTNFVKGLVIDDCVFDDNPYWEGIDLHGGEQVSITNNRVSKCYIGIHVVVDGSGTDDARVVEDPWVRNVLVSGNYVDADTLTRKASGIIVRGLEKMDGVAETTPFRAQNITIRDNTIRKYGNPSSQTSGAIVMYRAAGIDVIDNEISEFVQAGISLFQSLDDVDIIGNMIANPDSAALDTTYRSGIRVYGDDVYDVVMDRNAFVDTTGWKLKYGITMSAGTDKDKTELDIRENRFEIDGGSWSEFGLWAGKHAAGVYVHPDTAVADTLEGMIWYDSGADSLKFYDGTQWRALSY